MESGRTTSARRELPVTGAVGALAGAAGIHLLLTPEYLAEHVVYGVFLLVAAAVQFVLAVGVWREPTRRRVRAALATSLGLIATWIVTRAVVPPLLPETVAGPVELLGVVASGLELSTIVLLAPRVGLPHLRRRGTRAAVAAAPGVAFTALFLLASGALSYVSFDGPWPAIDVWKPGVSATTPLLYGLLVPHVWLVGSWATLSLIASAGLLVTVNVGQMLAARSGPTCAVPRRGVAAALPLFIGVSSCCGTPVALFLGASSIGLLYQATPWILAVTVLLLAVNLLVARPPHQQPARRHAQATPTTNNPTELPAGRR
jgi:hypothetical protein